MAGVAEISPLAFRRRGLLAWILLLADPYKCVTLLVSLFAVGLVMSQLGPEYPLFLMSGLIGGLVVLRYTDTAELLATANGCELIEKRLVRSGFTKTGTSSTSETWIPPLPKLLRWRDAIVTIERKTEEQSFDYKITGPYSYLARLSRGLPI
jgi:hypothetical protein